MDNITEKQNFLFKQIIQQNYDPQQFQQFMLSFKQNGQDLNQWNIEQLKIVVKNFKEITGKQKKQTSSKIGSSILGEDTEVQIQKKQSQQSSKQLQKQSKANRTTTIVQKEEGKYLQYDFRTKHQIFSQTIDCIIIPPNSLLTKDVVIKVQKFNKNQGGMFQQSYVSYTVSTPILGKKVERRYSDFEWLKKTLQLLHPGLPVPPIAKKGQYRRYDDKHLWKRMLILQMFLNKLIEIPELKAEQIVQNFLKLDDVVSFQKFKANFKNISPATELKNLRNMKGKINLAIEPRINKFLVRSQKNLTQTQPQIKGIYKQFKSAATMLESCSNTLKGISNTCQELNKKDEAFRSKVQLKYCPNNIFTCLSEATLRLSQQLQKQALTFRQMFYSLIKYESLHMINMLDSLDNLAEMQKNYQDSKAALIRKKLKLYEQGNISKWGISQNTSKKLQKTEAIAIMLPKQTKQIQKLRQKYALFNFQMYEQLNRFYTSKNYHIGRSLQQYCQYQTKISSQMMMIWVDMETNIMGMRQNKYIKKC